MLRVWECSAMAWPSSAARARMGAVSSVTCRGITKNVAVIPAKNADKSAYDYCLDVTAKQGPKNVVATLGSFAAVDRQIVAIMTPGIVASRCQGKADALVETSVGGNFDQRHDFYVVFN